MEHKSTTMAVVFQLFRVRDLRLSVFLEKLLAKGWTYELKISIMLI